MPACRPSRPEGAMTDTKPDPLERVKNYHRDILGHLPPECDCPDCAAIAAWEKERARPHVHDALADSYANLRAAVEKVRDEIAKQAQENYDIGDALRAATANDLQCWADALDAAL